MITNPDNWFPHFSVDGRIVSGSGAIFAEGRQIAATGWQARWLRPDGFIWNSGMDTRLTTPGGTVQHHAAAFAILAAGNGQWAGWNEQGVFLNGLPFDPAGDQPWISREGQFVYKTDRQSNFHAIIFNGHRITAAGHNVNPRCEGGAVVWSEHLTQYVLATRGWRGGGVVEDLRVIDDSEIESVPIPTPDGPFVLTSTQWGFFIRPWGGKAGWIYQGDCYTPDAICLGRIIHVTGWSGTQGRGLLLRFPLDAARAEIRSPQAQPVPVIPPAPAPEPEPQPAVLHSAVALPDHFHVVHAVERAYPDLLKRNTTDAARELYWRAAWALHQHDPNWGMLARSVADEHQVIGGSPVAVDRVAYQGANAIVDIISGAGDGPGLGGITWSVEQQPFDPAMWIQPPPFDGEPAEDAQTNGEAEELEALVLSLRADVDRLQRRCAALEAAALRYGSRAALRTHDGHVLSAIEGGGSELNTARDTVGPSETFTVARP